MNRSVLIAAVFVIVLSPGLVLAGKPLEKNDIRSLDVFNVVVYPFGYESFTFSNLEAGDTIYYDFRVTSGPGVDFFICDQENYDIAFDFNPDTTAYVRDLLQNVGGGSGSVTVNSYGTWYAVFSSASLLETSSITGYLGLTPPPLSYYAPIIILGVLLFVVALVSVAAVVYRRRSTPRQVPATIPEPTQVVQPSQAARNFCPYCGEPRTPPDARFCSSCGRGFAS